MKKGEKSFNPDQLKILEHPVDYHVGRGVAFRIITALNVYIYGQIVLLKLVFCTTRLVIGYEMD